jgi:hypothetical protein
MKETPMKETPMKETPMKETQWTDSKADSLLQQGNRLE